MATILVDYSAASVMSAFLIEKAGITSLSVPKTMGRIPAKPTGAFYVKVLTALVKDVYVHMSVKVSYGYVTEKAKFLSYHIDFTSISSLRFNPFMPNGLMEQKMRDIVTPKLGAEFMAAIPSQKRTAVKNVRSKLLEATNASAAHQLPTIPWMKKESRWAPRFELRRRSSGSAGAVASHVENEAVASAAVEPAPVEAAPLANVSLEPAPVEVAPVSGVAVEASPVASAVMEPAPVSSVEAVEAAPVASNAVEAVASASVEPVPVPSTSLEPAPVSDAVEPAPVANTAVEAVVEPAPVAALVSAVPAEATTGATAEVTEVETALPAAAAPAGDEAIAKLVTVASEESVKETLKESISTSPNRGASLPAKEEKEKEKEEEEKKSIDCFVSLDEADTSLFQTQARDAMSDLITSLRGPEPMGTIDREFEREMMLIREGNIVRPSVRE